MRARRTGRAMLRQPAGPRASTSRATADGPLHVQKSKRSLRSSTRISSTWWRSARAPRSGASSSRYGALWHKLRGPVLREPCAAGAVSAGGAATSDCNRHRDDRGCVPCWCAQLCPGGDLHHKTRDNPMPEADSVHVIRQVVDAIVHMHSLGYCHRELPNHADHCLELC